MKQSLENIAEVEMKIFQDKYWKSFLSVFMRQSMIFVLVMDVSNKLNFFFQYFFSISQKVQIYMILVLSNFKKNVQKIKIHNLIFHEVAYIYSRLFNNWKVFRLALQSAIIIRFSEAGVWRIICFKKRLSCLYVFLNEKKSWVKSRERFVLLRLPSRSIRSRPCLAKVRSALIFTVPSAPLPDWSTARPMKFTL